MQVRRLIRNFEYRKKGCLVHDSAGMTLEQVIGKIKGGGG